MGTGRGSWSGVSGGLLTNDFLAKIDLWWQERPLAGEKTDCIGESGLCCQDGPTVVSSGFKRMGETTSGVGSRKARVSYSLHFSFQGVDRGSSVNSSSENRAQMHQNHQSCLHNPILRRQSLILPLLP